MNEAAAAVLGTTQVAYIPDGRQIKDNTILMAEAARRLHCAGRGGACIQVDNSAAFDRVRWDFIALRPGISVADHGAGIRKGVELHFNGKIVHAGCYACAMRKCPGTTMTTHGQGITVYLTESEAQRPTLLLSVKRDLHSVLYLYFQ